MRLSSLSLVLFVALSALVGDIAQADRGLGDRVLIIVDEQLEGRRVGAKGAEPHLAKKLMAAGFQVVERYESDGVRSRIPLERLLHDEVAGNEVSAINAEIVIVGRVHLEKEPLPYGIRGSAYAADLELKVLLTDSGRVIYSGTGRAKATGSTAAASAKAADSLFAELVGKIKNAGEQKNIVELRVAGLLSAAHADRLAETLRNSPAIRAANVRYVASDDSVIDLQMDGRDVKWLGGLVERSGLVVVRRSANVIQAKFDAAASARRRVVIASFENRTKNQALDWIQTVGPEIFETELSNSKYLTAMTLDKRPTGKDAATAAKALDADFTMVATMTMVSTKLRFSATVSAPGGGAFVRAQVFGSDADAVDLVKELVWKVDQQLYKKVNRKSNLAGYETKVKKYAPQGAVPTGLGTVALGGDARQLRPAVGRVIIASASVEPIFTAQMSRYASAPFGVVTLQNVGKVEVRGIRLGVTVEEVASSEQLFSVKSLVPGASVQVPLRVVFDRDAMMRVAQSRPVRIDLVARYHDGESNRADSITESTVLHARNAMNWSRGEAIVSFVTHRDEELRAFANQVLSQSIAEGNALPTGLRGAVLLFDALEAVGIQYRRDPVAGYGDQAVDAVSFPRETLQKRVGDCDDLAVLYTTLLAATGRLSRIVYTPGHVFVAVDTELAAEQAGFLGGSTRSITLDGRAFIPVEVTQLGNGFIAAWDAGLREVGRYRGDAGKISYVDLAEAWRQYPPFPVAGTAVMPSLANGSAKKAAQDLRKIASGIFDKQGRSGSGGAKLVATNHDPNDPWSLVRKGAQAARSGDTNAAIEYLQKARKDRRARPAALNNLGNVYILAGKPNKSVGLYRKALAARVGRPSEVRVNLGYAYYQAGKGRRARREFLRAGTQRAKQLLKQLGLASAERVKGEAGPPRGERADIDTAYGMRAGNQRVAPLQVLVWIENDSSAR